MLVQFANGRSQLPAPTYTVSSGGSNSASRTLYIALQGQNPAGCNLLSSVVGPITVNSGQQLVITLPTTIRQPGERFTDFVISASATATPASSFVAIARVPAFDSGGAQITLPTTVTLSADAHFSLSAIVANPAALPTTNLLTGMRRGVSSLAQVFEYDPLASAAPNAVTVLAATPAPGRWLRVGGFSTVVAATTDPGGCAQDIRAINEAAVNLRPYAVNGQNGLVQRFWLVNDSPSDAILSGQRVMIAVFLGEIPRSELFEGLLRVVFRGYVTVATGALRTTIASTGETMRGLGQEILFENKKTDLILQDDLQPGEVYALDIYPNFRPEYLDNQVLQGSILKISLGLATQAGAFVEGGTALGDRIYPEYDRGLIVPQRVGALCLKRSGMVNSRSFVAIGQSPVLGLATATASQVIAINSNGSVYPQTAALSEGEAIRAKVSTLAGISDPCAWSTPITVSASKRLDVTCNHPSDGTHGTIRANYPDTLIAGNNAGQFNCTALTIYVRSTVSSVATIKKFEGRLIVDGASQTFQITDWNAGTTISSVPTAPSANFCLFAPVGTTAASTGSGNIPAGDIEVAFAYQMDGNQISVITHDPADGCIHTSHLTMAQVEAASSYWIAPVANLAALRSLSPLFGQVVEVLSVGGRTVPYQYTLAVASDDGSATSRSVKPASVTTGQPGEWGPLGQVDSLRLRPISDPSTPSGEVAIFVASDGTLKQRAGGNGAIVPLGAEAGVDILSVRVFS